MLSNRAAGENDPTLSYTTDNIGRFSIEIWSSNVIGDSLRMAEGNEIDLPIVSWDMDVLKDTNLKVGFGHFDLAPLFSGNKGDMNELFFEIKHRLEINKNNSIAPFFRLEWNQLIGHGQISSNIHVGTYHDWLIREGLSLNEKFAVVLDDGKGTDGGALFLYYGALNWSLTDRWSLDAPIVKITIPMFGMADREGTQAVIGVGLNYAISW